MEALKLSEEKFITAIKYAIYFLLLCCWKLWHISRLRLKKDKIEDSTSQIQTLTEQAVVLCSLSMPMKLSVSGWLEIGSTVIFKVPGYSKHLTADMTNF